MNATLNKVAFILFTVSPGLKFESKSISDHPFDQNYFQFEKGGTKIRVNKLNRSR